METSEAFDLGFHAYQLWQAYAEGASASNPYDEGTQDYTDWDAGWTAAGCERVADPDPIRSLEKMLTLPERRNVHILGVPGDGKTALIQALIHRAAATRT